MEGLKVVEGYGNDCPFPFFEGEDWYKVYNDGGHYIATQCVRKGQGVP